MAIERNLTTEKVIWGWIADKRKDTRLSSGGLWLLFRTGLIKTSQIWLQGNRALGRFRPANLKHHLLRLENFTLGLKVCKGFLCI